MANISFEWACSLFSKYGITLNSDQFALFSDYHRLLIDESSVQNVTRVTDPQEIWVRHFLDSAYLIRYIHDRAPKTFLDLGTGGGFPGIPTAILMPFISVVLLDSEERKLDFCLRVIRELGLSAKCLCGRAEELSKSAKYREQFDCVASRAVANGSMLCELALPFVKTGGLFAAFKGSGYDPSVERFFEASSALCAETPQVVDYRVENVDKHLILIEKSRPTPLQYPRRFAKIKRSPL